MAQPKPSFYNPFGNDADLSLTLELERPSAFSGHRDTLTRLLETSTPESDSDDGSDGTYTPTQHGLSLFRNHHQRMHRDTLARLHFKQNFSKALPPKILHEIASYLDPADCKNMRSTCRQWEENLPRPSLAAAQRLPAEILLEIFEHLLPSEFDAARHTCRHWFMVGLDEKIARTMMSASGSYPAYLQDLAQERSKLLQPSFQLPSPPGQNQGSSGATIDTEWLMSKRLATESRLSSS